MSIISWDDYAADEASPLTSTSATKIKTAEPAVIAAAIAAATIKSSVAKTEKKINHSNATFRVGVTGL